MPKLLRRPSLWIGLVLVALTGVIVIVRSRGPLVQTVRPQRRDLEQHLVSSGRVRVPTRLEIAAQLPGLVIAVGPAEGQRVKAGDLLVQLEDATARAEVAQAEAAVKQAQARVLQLRNVGAIVSTESLRQAETNLERARTDLERTAKLVQSQAVPAIELENARRAVDIARAQKTAAEAQQLAATPVGADSRVALTAQLHAEAQLTAARARLSQTRIVATTDGTVLSRTVELGDVIQPSEPLLVIAADAAIQLVFHPDERNLAWIQLGQKARAAADAYPQQVFDATVSYIAPSVDPQRGSIEVRLEVASPPAFLKPDMTLSIDLMIAAKPGALTVPSEVVIGAATPTPHTLVVDGGRVARRNVQLGIRGDGSLEIVSGIDETALVIVPDGRPLGVGARVRTESD